MTQSLWVTDCAKSDFLWLCLPCLATGMQHILWDHNLHVCRFLSGRYVSVFKRYICCVCVSSDTTSSEYPLPWWGSYQGTVIVYHSSEVGCFLFLGSQVPIMFSRESCWWVDGQGCKAPVARYDYDALKMGRSCQGADDNSDGNAGYVSSCWIHGSYW